MKLRDMRINKGISQQKLAKLLGVSFLTYSKWERYVGSPTPTNFERLCEYFGATPDDVLPKLIGAPVGTNLR